MHWVKRFQSDGIAGLRNKPGNGRKRIISTKKDKEAVREAIRKHRQSVSKARYNPQNEMFQGYKTKRIIL